ncbi:MAG TPA: pyridoxamine 5'-phosphate oxidase [Verrucomicrobiae bacterium]|nr:pyridoxamine 5'-phosphate oxidase [Verrucomicrobiae bacterium]
MSIADLRREYNLSGLRRGDLLEDPLAQFRRWFDQARGARKSGRIRRLLIKIYKWLNLVQGVEQLDLNAMILATADGQGRPSARVVLLKGLDERGFIFFTNYNSRKGRELAENPEAALVFYWPEQERQVCVAGAISKVPDAESESYFHSRPRGSQIGAWASDQSTPLKDRAELERKWRECETQFENKEVERPAYWGGYVLAPVRMEFWQGRPNRLHDRFRYMRQPDGTWLIERLSP